MRLILFALIAILFAGCQTPPRCVVTPNNTVECN